MCRLCDHLASSALEQREVLHSPAFSSQRRARYLGESGRRVAKAVLVEGKSPAIVLLSAAEGMRPEAVRESLGDDFRLVDSRRMSRFFPECETGLVPGFGKPFGLPVLMDRKLTQQPYLLIPGWTSCLSYKLSPEEYVCLESPMMVDVAAPVAANRVARPLNA